MGRRLGLAAAALLLIGGAAPATVWGDTPPEGERVVAARVDWGRILPLPEKRLEEATGIRPGVQVWPERLAEAVRALTALPQVRWAAVHTEPAEGPDRVVVRFVMERTLRLGRLVVTGARNLGADQVERAARLNPNDEVDTQVLAQVEERALAAYARAGYFGAKVSVADVAPEPGAPPGQVNVFVAVREGSQGRVDSVEYPGLPERLPTGYVLPFLRVRAGSAFDAATLREDLKRVENFLVKRGYLNPQVGPFQLDVVEDRVRITVPVQARERVEVTIVGRDGMLDRTVRRILNLTARRSLDKATLEEGRQRLLAVFKEDGYRDAGVELESTRVPDRPVTRVRVVIDRGRRHRTADVRVEGNAAFPDNRLKDVVRPGFHFLAEPVREGVIDDRAARIEGFYQAEGYPEAAVTYTITPAEGRGARDVVTYHVDEGRRWWVQDVAMEGLGPVVPEAAVAATEAATALRLAPYRRDRVRAARAQVGAALGAFGYVDAQVETLVAPEVRWRGKIGPGGVPLREVFADLTFQVVPGPQVRVGQVRIQGAFRTRPYVVAREVTVAPGDLYTPGALAETRRNLFRAAAFDRVRVGPSDPDDHDAVRDVGVQLTEGKPGAVELGVGYGEKDGVRGLIDLSYRDFLHRGHQAGIRLRYGQLRRSATLRYVLPWVGPFRVALHSRLLYEEEDLVTYDRRTWAAEVGIRRPVMAYVVLTVTYRLERNRFPRLPQDKIATLPERRRINVGSIFTSLVRDTRDDPFDPTRGTVVGGTYEQGAHALASQVQFAKATAQVAGFHSVRRGLVAAGRVQTGRVQRLFESTDVPVSERFFMGGQSSLRGYALDSVGVPGETLISGAAQGGLVMLLTSLELRAEGEGGWGVVAFVDAGNVWKYAESLGLSDMRVGAGPGLRFSTPVGPLRLDLGYKVDRNRGEDPWRLHFTLGHTF